MLVVHSLEVQRLQLPLDLQLEWHEAPWSPEHDWLALPGLLGFLCSHLQHIFVLLPRLSGGTTGGGAFFGAGVGIHSHNGWTRGRGACDSTRSLMSLRHA